MTDQPAENSPIDYAARAAALETELAEAHVTANARLLRAELKTEAMRAGILDLDGLKLLDTSKLKLTPEGTPPDAPEIMATLKREKPWLFHVKTNTSYPAPPPAPEPAKQRKALDMTHQEWQAARAQMLKQR